MDKIWNAEFREASCNGLSSSSPLLQKGLVFKGNTI